MKNKGSMILLATLAIGLLSGTAVADNHGDRRYDNGRYDHDYGVSRYAFDNGFREGQKAGAEDGRRGKRFQATEHGVYRKGLDGYRGHISKDAYRNAFREGYMRGYREEYSENIRYRHSRHDHDWNDR